jgi:hypothetical protein
LNPRPIEKMSVANELAVKIFEFSTGKFKAIEY